MTDEIPPSAKTSTNSLSLEFEVVWATLPKTKTYEIAKIKSYQFFEVFYP